MIAIRVISRLVKLTILLFALLVVFFVLDSLKLSRDYYYKDITPALTSTAVEAHIDQYDSFMSNLLECWESCTERRLCEDVERKGCSWTILDEMLEEERRHLKIGHISKHGGAITFYIADQGIDGQSNLYYFYVYNMDEFGKTRKLSDKEFITDRIARNKNIEGKTRRESIR